ncbi:MAG TPA: S53 family peptidase, partial [Verrucomicrobiae bacterium]|nr:S53 family peptidase [Verrucomicrobiae bacterium]
MNERRTIVAAFLAGCLLITTTGMAQTARILTEHGREVVGRLQPLGDIDAGANLQVAVGLPLHNKEALTNLLNDLYDPSSPQFHRYLSVSQFTEKFGPSAEDYQKVIDYLTSRHLKVITTHANRMVVGVSGAGADMEKAFHVHLRNYQHPTDQRTFFAPDTEPRVDAGVPMLDVMGLDNYIVPHPRDLRRKPLSRLGGPGITNYGGPGVTNYSSEEGSGPGGLYMASDLRTAYYPGVTNTGAGQYVAVFEFGPYWTNDIYTYETNCGLSTNIVVSNIFLDGVTEPPTAGTDAGEQAGDVEYEMAIAPGATILYYGGGVANDIFGRMASDNLAGSISDSWGFGIDSTTEQLWQEFVAQGQTLFAASGDGGATVAPGNIAGPYVCLVGGTELFTVSPGGAWASEVVWPGSGGGVGTMYAIPNYQQGINMAAVNGSMTMRNTPDVATFAIGLFLAANGSTGWGGGTSFSSPQYAGMIALVNQQAAILGKPRVGFFNPALYAIGKSTNYTNCFHDITVGNNTNSTTGPDKFIAATGYDLCTGWGSPNGSNLINALVGFGTNNFLLSANPDSINLTIGGSETVLVLAQPMNGFNGTVSLSVSGAPTGLADSFSSSSTTSTSILTLSAGTTATPGTYTINLNGASGSISQTIAIAVNIVGETPGFSKVSLASEFNRIAIYTDGAGFSSGGGADASGNAYSANLLGSALNWNGCLFNEGSANANDAIVCSGQTISLPSGNFSSLQILAAGVGSAQLSQPFTVTYTDGSTSIFSRSLSVWNQNQIVPGPLNFPGESVVATTIYANTSGGTKDITMNAYIYGYSFGLNNTKTVKSITLPGDGNVLVFAMTLANDFTLYDLPSSLVLTAGGTSRSYLVSGPVASFSGDVALSASGLPAEVTASFSPSASTNFSILTLTANATAQPTETNVILTGTLDGIVHNVDLNLAVMTPIPNTVAVSLSSAFNCDGTYNDGTTFSAAGGLDGAGNAFSANLLGSSANWNGGFFSFGPAGSPDAVQCAGQTITLPAGQYTGLLLLGAAINSSQANQSFQIKYTDGTSATVNQSMSVWTTAQNYPGESIAVSTAHIDTSSGTNNTEIPVNLYGYTLPLNDSKTVQSITLPNNSDAVVLALTLANAPTSVSLASSFNRGALYTDGTSFSGGLDGDGNAYSATQLGSSPIWDGVQFKLGAANVNNVISCDGQTISLPANRYTSLLMLATGVNGSQTSQNFSVTYTDG